MVSFHSLASDLSVIPKDTQFSTLECRGLRTIYHDSAAAARQTPSQIQQVAGPVSSTSLEEKHASARYHIIQRAAPTPSPLLMLRYPAIITAFGLGVYLGW